MILEVNFLLYMSNVTLPGVTVIQNKSAIGCSLQTILANRTAFIYDKIAETCLIHPRTFACTTGLIHQPGSTYYFSRYVESCADVQLCDPSYSEDGEYWLYPAIYNHKAVKIYCKGMNTTTPSEYLSLPFTNIFFYPNKHYSGTSCTEVFSLQEHAGQTNYIKLGIDISTMTIIETDSNFSIHDGLSVLKYGWVEACSGFTPPCDYRGWAKLRVIETGLIFSDSNEWMAFGDNGHFSIDFRSNYVMEISGDGDCGGGRPKYPLKLEIDPFYRPPQNSAIEPVCV